MECSDIDSLRFQETPEGIDLELRLAGPVVRAAALGIDTLIKGVLYLALTPLLAFSGLGVGLVLLGVLLIEWFYPVFFEIRRGATPGKRAMGLAVVQDDGTPVGPASSVIRNLLRVRVAATDQIVQIFIQARAVAARAGQGVVGADPAIQARKAVQGRSGVAPEGGLFQLSEQSAVRVPGLCLLGLELLLSHRPRAR